VERTALTLGTRQADAVEVVQGLSNGDRIVTAGHQKLFPGAKVIPTEAGAAPSGPGGAGGAGGAAGAGAPKETKVVAKTTTKVTAKPAAKGGEKK
jgi:membrane fusion protein (multidrug efflux system)